MRCRYNIFENVFITIAGHHHLISVGGYAHQYVIALNMLLSLGYLG